MDIQILVATMNRKDFSFLNKMGLWGSVFVVNQCDWNGYEEIKGQGFTASVINTTQRGISNSRNEALLHLSGDVFLTADDDIVYSKGAFEAIQRVFQDNPMADIVAFNINKLNVGERGQNHKISKWQKAPSNKYYNSISLAFRTISIRKANLFFHPWFGAGSIYSMGEENLFLRCARKAGLKIFECPEVIATHDFSESSWFNGYNEKWFHDMGAWVKYAYPRTSFFMKHYYLKYLRNSNLSFMQAERALNQGIVDSKFGIPFKISEDNEED